MSKNVNFHNNALETSTTTTTKGKNHSKPIGAPNEKSSSTATEPAKKNKRRRKEENRILNQAANALLAHRRSLPIFDAREPLVKAIRDNATVVVVGETGSGKTTQIPQYLVESGFAKPGSMIGVTQPRRVAATSLANRVGEEMGSRVGHKVGYSVRFQSAFSPQTCMLKFLTDGMLLRETLTDPLLSSYSVIVLDEAHERTVRTDILFGMVKDVQRKRLEMLKNGVKVYPPKKNSSGSVPVQPLKVVVMSATLDAERFSEYFDDAPILYVSGRQHPVKVYNTAEPQPDYLDAALVTTLQIHTEMPNGDILVFLTGQEEIESLAALITQHASQLPPSTQKILVCPIFAALPPAQQALVFQPAPAHTRKVILATNIAETSITIAGVRYVVDAGVSKMKGFNAKIGIECLTIQPISRASARQRTGRAGREAPGICYRLYTEDSFFNDLPEDTEPEIKRCNLSSVILMLKAAGVSDPVNFDYMDKPSRASLERALESLYALEAIGKDGKLTDLGRLMAEFPIEPAYAKALIQSKEYGCTREVVDIISLLSADTIFFTPNEKREEAAEARRKFTHPDGDHLTLLAVLKAYQQVNGDSSWCMENFINMRNMKHAMDVRKQLVQLCSRLQIPPTTSCGHETDSIHKSFLSGFFQNTAILQPDSTYKSVVGGRTVSIHPTSVLFGKKVEAIMFNEMVFTTRQYVRGVSAVQGSWLSTAAPRYFGNV